MPQALTVLWDATRADLPDGEKLSLVLDFDRILGLRLSAPQAAGGELELDERARALVEARAAARAEKNWAEADRLRDQLLDLGLTVTDTPDGPVVERAP